MNKTTLAAAALLLAASACSSEQDHGHDHDHEGGHVEEPAVEPVDDPVAEPVASTAVNGTMGPWIVELQPGADSVRLVAADAAGNAIAPDGEISLALTAASGGTEMVTLTPDGAGWSGPANISPDGAYMAQLTGPVGSARLMWGSTATGHEIQNPEPAEEAADGHDHGGHDHGGHEH